MKPKKLNTRLFLNKSTVASLNGNEMNEAFGGKTCSVFPCPATESCTQVNTCYTNCTFDTCFDSCTCNTMCPTQTGTPESDPCCITC